MKKDEDAVKDKPLQKTIFFEWIGGIKLAKPIPVEITKEGDYVASIDSLGLFKYGDDPEEVLDELKWDLFYLYQDLFENDHKLHHKENRRKEILKSYLP